MSAPGTQEQRFDEPRLSAAFSHEITAATDDIDELGHVSNLVYLRWVLDIAMAHSSSAGWDYARYVREGAVFVVREHHVTYLAPAFAGERLRVTTWIASWRGASSERRTRIERVADSRELAQARTLWVLVSTDATRPRRIPAELVAAFT